MSSEILLISKFKMLFNFCKNRTIFFIFQMKNEIYWQKRKTEEEMTKVAQEIKEVEFTLEDKLDPTRLVETRLENRSLR